MALYTSTRKRTKKKMENRKRSTWLRVFRDEWEKKKKSNTEEKLVDVMEGAFHEEIWLHIGIVHIFVHCQQLCKREKRRRFPLMSFLPSSFTHSPFTHFFPSLLSIGIDQFRWVEVSSVILKFKHDDKYSKVQNVLRNVLCNLLAEVIFSFTTRAQDLKKGGLQKKKKWSDR